VDSTRAATRAQALWALEGIGALKPAIVVRAMDDGHPGVRRQAVRLSETWVTRAPELLAAVVKEGAMVERDEHLDGLERGRQRAPLPPAGSVAIKGPDGPRVMAAEELAAKITASSKTPPPTAMASPMFSSDEE
jgi:hypothetical protein